MGNKDFKNFPEKVLTMIFDYGKVNTTKQKHNTQRNKKTT